MTPLPIAILGAGPVGLAAAARAVSRGLEFTILEQGPHAGAAVADWGHVRVFSLWKYNIDPVARDLLQAGFRCMAWSNCRIPNPASTSSA